MKAVTVHILNAFVNGGEGGNPAGVVLDADHFSDGLKQQIASKVGLSETAFVSTSQTDAFKLEFFTPIRRVSLCGHATVATFSHLMSKGLVSGHQSSMETTAGSREIFFEDDAVFLQQTAPTYSVLQNGGAAVSREEVLLSLGIDASALFEGLEPTVVNTGESFLIVPLKGRRALAELVPDFGAIQRISDALGLIGYYAFTTETHHPDKDAGARMFAPSYGISEESATGMAAGPLACYLHKFLGIGKPRILIEQGFYMKPPSPSELKAELSLDFGTIEGLKVGGEAAVVNTMDMVVF